MHDPGVNIVFSVYNLACAACMHLSLHQLL